MLDRPLVGEEYVDYYDTYVSKVPDGDVLQLLETQVDESVSALAGVDESKAAYRYEPGKWSIKQVIGHLCDVERCFQYRALAFLRGDKTPLPGFEQDDYVEGANFDDRTLVDILDEFRAVRTATVALFRSVDDAAFARFGTASGFNFTVRAIAYIVAGHERHHMGVLKERYL